MISLEQKHFTLHSVQDDAVDPPSWHSSLNLHGNPFRFFLLSGISFVSWGTLKLFENFQLLSKWAQWFRSLMKMYSSLLLQLVFFCLLHAFKYKFHDGNYKKCISCEFQQHQQKKTETTFHWMLHSHLLWVEHVCIYGCMMINVYLYLCMFCCCTKKYNLYFTVVELKRYAAPCCMYTERIKRVSSFRHPCTLSTRRIRFWGQHYSYEIYCRN